MLVDQDGKEISAAATQAIHLERPKPIYKKFNVYGARSLQLGGELLTILLS